MLTYLGKSWGWRDTRYSDEQWRAWVGAVTAKGGCVTLDLGPNYDAKAGPVGTFDEAQLRQLKAIAKAVGR